MGRVTVDYGADTSTLRTPYGLADSLEFWFLVWFGTSFAGGIFGVLVAGYAVLLGGQAIGGSADVFFLGMLLGLIYGFVLAGVCSIPILSTTAVLTWAVWISRFRIVSAAIGGGITGITATLLFDSLQLTLPILLAGALGAAGAGLAGRIHDTKMALRLKVVEHRAWQFTLRDLFLRMTVLATTLALWLCLLRLLRGFGNWS